MLKLCWHNLQGLIHRLKVASNKRNLAVNRYIQNHQHVQPVWKSVLINTNRIALFFLWITQSELEELDGLRSQVASLSANQPSKEIDSDEEILVLPQTGARIALFRSNCFLLVQLYCRCSVCTVIFFVICLYVHTQYIYSSLIMTIIARETISMNLSGTMHGFVSHLLIMQYDVCDII